jgi:hypothetical protein
MTGVAVAGAAGLAVQAAKCPTDVQIGAKSPDGPAPPLRNTRRQAPGRGSEGTSGRRHGHAADTPRPAVGGEVVR